MKPLGQPGTRELFDTGDEVMASTSIGSGTALRRPAG